MAAWRKKGSMTHEEVAENLLTPLWQGIPNEYKAKYARTIWNQFENNIRSSAYTAHAPQFLSKITNRLAIGLSEAGAKSVSEVINSAPERELLKMLREDTTLLVLMVRVANEARREDWKQKQTKKGQDANLNL